MAKIPPRWASPHSDMIQMIKPPRRDEIAAEWLQKYNDPAAIEEIELGGVYSDSRFFCVKDSDLEKLINFRTLRLRTLKSSNQKISIAYMGASRVEILSRGFWPTLTTLKLNYGNIGNKGIHWLVRARLPHLTELNLSNHN